MIVELDQPKDIFCSNPDNAPIRVGYRITLKPESNSEYGRCFCMIDQLERLGVKVSRVHRSGPTPELSADNRCRRFEGDYSYFHVDLGELG